MAGAGFLAGAGFSAGAGGGAGASGGGGSTSEGDTSGAFGSSTGASSTTSAAGSHTAGAQGSQTAGAQGLQHRARHRANSPHGRGAQQLTHGRAQQRPAKPPRYLQATAPSTMSNNATAKVAKTITFRRITTSSRLETDGQTMEPQRPHTIARGDPSPPVHGDGARPRRPRSEPRGPAKPPRRSKPLPTQRGPTIGASMLWWDTPGYQTTLTSLDFPRNGFLVGNRKRGTMGGYDITIWGANGAGQHIRDRLWPRRSHLATADLAAIVDSSANGGPTVGVRATRRTTPGCRSPPRRTGWHKRQA